MPKKASNPAMDVALRIQADLEGVCSSPEEARALVSEARAALVIGPRTQALNRTKARLRAEAMRCPSGSPVLEMLEMLISTGNYSSDDPGESREPQSGAEGEDS